MKSLTSPTTRNPSSRTIKSSAGFVWSYRLLWITFVLFFLSTSLGKLWDRFWHLTHVFETFWSPPHLFVTTMTTITVLLVALLSFAPPFRLWFGPLIRLPLIKVEVAGSLIMLGAGLITLGISIMLDAFWHTAFGFDETQWSLPHNLIVTSWLIIILSFVACLLAFHHRRPMSWFTKLVLALLILSFLCPAILGPFYLNYAPSLLHAQANIPVNRAQPVVQHLYRIYFAIKLSRQENPLFIPFATFFVGIALAFLRQLDRRASIFLLTPLLWSLMFMVRDWYILYFLHYHNIAQIKDLFPVLLQEPSLWVPLPLFVAGLVDFTLRKIGLSEFWIQMTNAGLFGFLTFLIWHSSPLMVLLVIPALPLMVLGERTGKWIYRLLEKPVAPQMRLFFLLSCAELPAVFAIIDLILRKTIP